VSASRATSEFDETSLIDAILGSDAGLIPDDHTESRGALPVQAADRTPVLSVRGLDGPPAVHDVSFDLFPGEVLGLGGLVGSGRSEIAHLLIGLTRPTSGSVRLAGREIRVRNPAAALRAGIALVPEDRRGAGLVLDFDVRDNTTLASLDARCHAWTPIPSRRAEREVTEGTIARLQVATTGPQQTVRTLSGGNQQKVVIGKYLLRDPRVLIVDEPAVGIDVHAKREIFQLLRRLAEGGAAVLMISSDFSELVEWCDRVLGVVNSTVTGELAGAEITERAVTELAYGRRAPTPA
jgi:ribose transport system ATP-binding protein